MKFEKSTSYQLAIAILAALLFVPFLGGVHLFDWDEINFAESAREMIASGDYLTVKINFLPFWEKPPLFIWMQVLSMKVFGINEFAARFPNAICGIVTLLVIFNIGRKLKNVKFGLLWVLAFAGSILPFIYFKSGIIDPWFNLFIFLGIYFFIPYWLEESRNRKLNLIISAVFIGLGIMTKGPVALLIFGLCAFVFWAIHMFRLKVKLLDVLLFLIVMLVVGGFWFLLQIATGHFGLVKDFFIYQVRLFNTKDAGHGGFFLYHFVVLLIGVFPSSIFALKSFKKIETEDRNFSTYRKWMIVLFWVVLILFTIVKTKIVHYSSLCYFPLSFIAAYTIYLIDIGKETISKLQKTFLLVISVLFLCITASFPLIEHFRDKIIQSGLIADEFAMGNLEANVHWTGFEFLIGLSLFFSVLLFIYYHKRSFVKAIYILFLGTALFTSMAAIWLTPKIEGYSQLAAIEFFQSLQGKKCYVETLGYKSYAHLFYSRKVQPLDSFSYSTDSLLKGKLDRDAYFSSKITSKESLLNQFPELQVLYEKNGFVFYLRKHINFPITKLSDKVWLIKSFFNLSNNTIVDANHMLIEDSSELILINTPWNDENTKLLINQLETRFHKPVNKVIFTHSHIDCAGGIRETTRRGIISYSLDKTNDILSKNGDKIDVVFHDSLRIKLFDSELLLLYPGKGHSSDNIVVWYPKNKILYGGCLIKSLTTSNKGNIDDADLAAWPQSIQKLKKLFPQSEIIIPGHSAIGDIKLFDHTLSIISRK